MRAWTMALGLTVSAVALAAPFVEDLAVEDAMKADGLSVVVLRASDSCDPTTDGWMDAGVADWLTAQSATVVEAPRTREHLDMVVGDGFRAAQVQAAYRDGAEIDRACGCMDADALTSWLTGVAEGTTAADALRAELANVADGTLDTATWFELVEVDTCAGRYGAAFATLEKLWTVLPEKAVEQRELRLTRVAHDMGVLALKHPPAKERLIAMRDALTDDKDADVTALDEWLALNRILLDDAATLAWYDEVKDDKALAGLVEHQAPNLFVLLVEAGRWADAGSVIDDPKAWLAQWKKSPGGAESATWGYAALVAAGRLGEAKAIGKDMIKVLPEGTACTLIAKTTEVGAASAGEKPIAKACDDPSVVEAWMAAL